MRRLLTPTLGLTCLLGLPPAARTATSEPAAADVSLDEAHRLVEDEEFELVVRRIQDLQQLLTLEPEPSRAELELHLAEMLLQRADLLGFRLLDTPEDDDKERDALEKELTTDRFEALEVLRSCTASGGLDAEKQAHGLYLLAGLLSERGDVGSAIEALQALERSARTPVERARAAQLQGYVLLGSDDLIEPAIHSARAAFERAHAADPSQLGPLLGLGETAELLDMTSAAFQHFATIFERVDETSPREKIVRRAAMRGLARSLSRSGPFDDARAALAALRVPADPIWPLLARSYRNKRAHADALAAYLRAIPLASTPRERLALHVEAMEPAAGTGRRAEVARVAGGIAESVVRARALAGPPPWVGSAIDKAEDALLIAIEDIRLDRSRWSAEDDAAVLRAYLSAFGDSVLAPRVHHLIATRDPRDDKSCREHRLDAQAFLAASTHPHASAELALHTGHQAVRSLSLCRPPELDGDRPRPSETDEEIIPPATLFLDRFGSSEVAGIVARLAGDAASARRDDDAARLFYARAVDAEGEGFVDAVLAQARHLRAIGDMPALEERAAAAAADPRLPTELRRGLSGIAERTAYLLAGRAPEVERADRLIDVAERYVDGVLRDNAIFEAGTIFADAGRTTDALQAFEQVIDSAPTSNAAARARIAMGRLLESLGRHDEASEAYTAWFERSADLEGVTTAHLDWVRGRLARIHRARGSWRALWATEAMGLSADEAHTIRVRLALERLEAGDPTGARRLAADATGTGDGADALAIIRACQPENVTAFGALAAHHTRRGPLSSKALAWCAVDTLATLLDRLPEVGGGTAPTVEQARGVFQAADRLVNTLLGLDSGAPAIEAVAAWAEIIGAFAVALSPEPIEDPDVADEAARLRSDAWAAWTKAHAGRARRERTTAARSLGGPTRRLDGRLSHQLARAFRRIVDAENRAFGELFDDAGGAPVTTEPADAAPADAPADDAPADDAPADDTPADDTPADDTPADAPADDPPADPDPVTGARGGHPAPSGRDARQTLEPRPTARRRPA